jgi:stage II sporulation protein D
VADAVPETEIRGFDLRIADDTKLLASPDRASRWEFHCQDGRIRATSVNEGDSDVPVRTIEVREPAVIQSETGFLTFRNQPFRDVLKVYSVGSFCEVVNEVDFESYLKGIVNMEFNSKWSEEAIGAQVVAARTYALYQMLVTREKKGSHFDVDSTERDQVYGGPGREDTRASIAVDRTRGWVLTVGEPGHFLPVKAFYSSTCGGMTELPQRVWGTAYNGFSHRVSCPFCTSSPKYRWSTKLSTRQLVADVQLGVRNDGPQIGWPSDWSQAIQTGHLVDVRTMNLGPIGRVAQVTLVWEVKGRIVKLALNGGKFRDWIGAAKLLSAAFTVHSFGFKTAGLGFSGASSASSDRLWAFDGRGNGHGVGMCQWGAKVMGERGYKTAAILNHYYPDAILRKMW